MSWSIRDQIKSLRKKKAESDQKRKTRDPRPRVGTIDPGEAYERPQHPNRTPRADGKPNCKSCGHNAFKTVVKGEVIACRFCEREYLINKKVIQEE